MQKISELSVFFPAYDEEKNIKETVTEAAKLLPTLASKWEIIVIDDGSEDRTSLIVKELGLKNKNIRLIQHPQNYGYGAAIKTGLKNCRYKIICHVDSDGQFTFGEVKYFLPLLKTADLVLGYRKKRTDSFYRQLLQKTLWIVDYLLFGLNVRDVDCGFKVFKKEVLVKIGKLKTESAITETEFVVKALKAGFKFAQVGVSHHPRMDGTQTGGKFKVIFKAAKEGLWLWWLINFKEKLIN